MHEDDRQTLTPSFSLRPWGGTKGSARLEGSGGIVEMEDLSQNVGLQLC